MVSNQLVPVYPITRGTRETEDQDSAALCGAGLTSTLEVAVVPRATVCVQHILHVLGDDVVTVEDSLGTLDAHIYPI